MGYSADDMKLFSRIFLAWYVLKKLEEPILNLFYSSQIKIRDNSAVEIVPCFARPKRHVIFSCDVNLCTAFETNMDDSAGGSTASSSKIKRDGRYCVVGAPNNISCKNNSYTDGISMHQFPTDPLVRNKWVKFVRRHRADFHASNVTQSYIVVFSTLRRIMLYAENFS